MNELRGKEDKQLGQQEKVGDTWQAITKEVEHFYRNPYVSM